CLAPCWWVRGFFLFYGLPCTAGYVIPSCSPLCSAVRAQLQELLSRLSRDERFFLFGCSCIAQQVSAFRREVGSVRWFERSFRSFRAAYRKMSGFLVFKLCLAQQVSAFRREVGSVRWFERSFRSFRAAYREMSGFWGSYRILGGGNFLSIQFHYPIEKELGVSDPTEDTS